MNELNLLVAIASYLCYLDHFDFLALPAKAGNKTIYMVFDTISARALIGKDVVKKLWKLDGQELRWKGLMIDRIKPLHLPKPKIEFTINKRWDEFEWKSGNRAYAQETAVCRELNRVKWLNDNWTHIGTCNPLQYNPDILSSNGVMVEVKGFGSPVHKH